jgi:hypothetical protein
MKCEDEQIDIEEDDEDVLDENELGLGRILRLGIRGGMLLRILGFFKKKKGKSELPSPGEKENNGVKNRKLRKARKQVK